MAQVVETIDVDVPVSTAYNEWTQFEQFPKFLSFVKEITQKSDTLTHWTVNVGGVEREFDAEIVEQKPDERIAWNSIDGETDHAGVVTFHRLSDSSSRVAVQLDWEPSDLKEKAGAALGFDDRAVKGDLENFKKYIEERGVEEGAWRGTVEN